MEARKFEEIEPGTSEQVIYSLPEDKIESGIILAQEYHPLHKKGNQSLKNQRRELSFFLNVSSYSLLFAFVYPILAALTPLIISFPIALLAPIGIIILVKKLYKFKYKK
ncbi:DUF3270 family protein [Lactovum miscens]|uniref:Uncharacterized protein n=1 Tax=Lactovum miscens TaxID=190387 RepID=A0A841C671_9LACT|nr:DUF3270 family protein [Lactovum miscens]MBB5887248.1 hypothetical protein [Lactovum miscens]